MSAKGNCYDNAAVVRRANSLPDCSLILLTFLNTIKAELIWRHNWENCRQTDTAIVKHINDLYNPPRRHSVLSQKYPPWLLNGRWHDRALGTAQIRDGIRSASTVGASDPINLIGRNRI